MVLVLFKNLCKITHCHYCGCLVGTGKTEIQLFMLQEVKSGKEFLKDDPKSVRDLALNGFAFSLKLRLNCDQIAKTIAWR